MQHSMSSPGKLQALGDIVSYYIPLLLKHIVKYPYNAFTTCESYKRNCDVFAWLQARNSVASLRCVAVSSHT